MLLVAELVGALVLAAVMMVGVYHILIRQPAPPPETKKEDKE